jgi:hypothetical protein
MVIHFRNAGDKTPRRTLERVFYFEPLPGGIQFTQEGVAGGDVQFIEYGLGDNFVFEGQSFDFCETCEVREQALAPKLAAAPAMYDALKTTLAYFMRSNQSHAPEVRVIRAALAQAEGSTK